MINWLKNNRLVLTSTALYAVAAFAVIPVGVFPHAFDKSVCAGLRALAMGETY